MKRLDGGLKTSRPCLTYIYMGPNPKLLRESRPVDLISEQPNNQGSDEMLLLKSCPRCQGDIHINRDIYGEYRECLQCGQMVDIDNHASNLGPLITRGIRKTHEIS